MADALINATIKVTLEKAVSLATDRIGLLFGFKKDLASMTRSLGLIREVLADAEERQGQRVVHEWLKSLEDVAFDADNVLDELNYEFLRHEVKSRNQLERKGFTGVGSGLAASAAPTSTTPAAAVTPINSNKAAAASSSPWQRSAAAEVATQPASAETWRRSRLRWLGTNKLRPVAAPPAACTTTPADCTTTPADAADERRAGVGNLQRQQQATAELNGPADWSSSDDHSSGGGNMAVCGNSSACGSFGSFSNSKSSNLSSVSR